MVHFPSTGFMGAHHHAQRTLTKESVYYKKQNSCTGKDLQTHIIKKKKKEGGITAILTSVEMQLGFATDICE